jgi:protein-disulfide isomerase
MTMHRWAAFLLTLIVFGSANLSAQTTIAPYTVIRADRAVPAGTVATINGKPISIDELDPRFGDAVRNLDTSERQERKRALEEAISIELFALEGRARGISGTDVAAQEIQLRTKEPTPVQIRQVYTDHLTEFGGATFDAVKPQIVGYLKEQQTDAILSALAQRLRTKFPVTLSTDVNSPTITANSTIATIAGKPVLAGPLLEQLKPSIYEIRSQLYTALRNSLDQLLYARLVIEDAHRRGVEPETIIRAEITEKTLPVPQADVDKYYSENKTYFEENHVTVDAARNAIVEQLENIARARLEADLANRLKIQFPMVDYLVEPELPVLTISVDDDPSRGDVNAAVTVVMFTDFQCPACAKTHPILQELLKPYGNKVHFVVRDFPLAMHPDSRKAAEAAGAANAQGKFFEYIELLYKNQTALGIPQLKQYATQIGLDRAKFDLELLRGTYAKEIQHDVEDGARYGIRGTPAIYVNGRRVMDISATGLQQALDRAFGTSAPGGGANR